MGKILKSYGYLEKKSESYKRFEEILLYIDSHYKERLDRNSIAKEFGYSPTYFSRLFEESFHCGLCQYINNLRYERTLAEIGNSPERKTEIILGNGFNNVQSFYRINRKRKAQYDELKDFHS